MPTETEHYTNEELLRDAERGIEDENAHEEIGDREFEKAEDDLEIPKETEDEALQDVLEYKGGHPEDWELTHRSSGEYVFNGSEMINAATGESLTQQIENGYDAGYIKAHHDTLELLKAGESMIMLPDYEDEDGVLHVTHLHLGPDNSITYEIRSTKISEREEEEIFDVEEVAENAPEQNHVEWHEETEITPEERVEAVAETAEHFHETTFDISTPVEATFETPVAQEVAPTITMRIEERTEKVLENPTQEVAEIKEEVKETSWLSRFLRSESPPLAQEENNSLESLPVFVENNIDVVEVTEQVTLDIQPEVEIAPVIEIEQTEHVIERSAEQVEPVFSQPESFVAPQIIEHIPASAQQTVEIQREIFEAIVEQKQPAVEKFEQPPEYRGRLNLPHESSVTMEPATLKTGRQQPEIKVEQRPIILKTPEVRISPPVVRRPEVRSVPKPEIRSVEKTFAIKKSPEFVKDEPISFENSKNERVALSGNEILLRSLGIPATTRIVQSREFAGTEGLRPTRYSPQQDNDQSTSQPQGRVSSLNGISMRRAA